MDGHNPRTTRCYACNGTTFTATVGKSIVTGTPTLTLTCVGCGEGFFHHLK